MRCDPVCPIDPVYPRGTNYAACKNGNRTETDGNVWDRWNRINVFACSCPSAEVSAVHNQMNDQRRLNAPHRRIAECIVRSARQRTTPSKSAASCRRSTGVQKVQWTRRQCVSTQRSVKYIKITIIAKLLTKINLNLRNPITKHSSP